MKITVLDGNALNPGDLSWEPFKKFGDLTVYPRTPSDLVSERIGDSDAILLNKIIINEDIVKKAENLKYIGVLATGYNVIDIPSVKKAGITVTNIPSYSTMAVAQHVFAFILHFTNHVALHNDSVKNGGWIESPDFSYSLAPLTELAGKTLGIYGYGNIGKQVYKIAEAFGMKVLVCPHHFSKDIPGCVSQEDLFKNSDIITLHAPLTSETKEIISEKNISMMKNGVSVINTARGGLVNESDVRKALESGKIAHYACDVLLEEPMNPETPLNNAPNTIITPHIAWAPLETRQRLMNIALDNFEKWLKGEKQNTIY